MAWNDAACTGPGRVAQATLVFASCETGSGDVSGKGKDQVILDFGFWIAKDFGSTVCSKLYVPQSKIKDLKSTIAPVLHLTF